MYTGFNDVFMRHVTSRGFSTKIPIELQLLSKVAPFHAAVTENINHTTSWKYPHLPSIYAMDCCIGEKSSGLNNKIYIAPPRPFRYKLKHFRPPGSAPQPLV